MTAGQLRSLRAVEAIARVAEPRNDIPALVQAPVHRRDHDMDVRMGGVQALDPRARR